MKTLTIHHTATAQWQALIQDAEQACHTQLGEELQSYLVFLLMQHGKSEWVDSIMALKYLNALETQGRLQEERLREVGDQCLLFAGLFPGRAERRRVRMSYYVNLGISAYEILSHSLSGVRMKVYEKLSRKFVALMDVLQATRELGDDTPLLQPLQAMELWNDTNSQHAFATLQRYTQALPVKVAVENNPTRYKARNTQHDILYH
ncbi:MAG: hypothetical protein BWK79_09625 [Beggiatoa sp. IS2]|nr:MAG: hypothetical protein BWK79_09625 [Beggiatoa sp. IS2]